jgi:type IV pilus assembly protein PilY1
MNTNLKILVRSAVLTVVAGFGGLQAADAATVDLAGVPMVSGVSKVVPPNVYFILDDSGSMDYDYMPDDVGNDSAKNCFRNFGYNKIYYNPSVTYVAPKNADGTAFANSSYTAAKTDGFSSTSTTVDLSKTQYALQNNPFAVVNNSNVVTVTHTAHGLTAGMVVSFSPSTSFRNITISGSYTIVSVTTNSYTITASTKANATDTTNGGNGIVETSPVPSVYYYEYTSSPASPPTTCASDGSYTKKSPSTAAEKTNFANWYSYYRTRILMMKSASGRAFAGVDDKYRVGFSAISETGTGAAKFLNVSKFTCCGSGTQKYSFYQKLYAQSPSSYTPLRGALSKAGRLYSGTLSGANGTADPMQFSCQQNFTILTTDGYWNTRTETTNGNASSNYGPFRADNTTLIGDWDAATLATATNPTNGSETTTVRPYLDAGPYSNTLADIAAYYYRNDIRKTSMLGGYLDDGSTRLDVSADNVPAAGADSATWQHMTTFTIGLGVAGTLKYREDYLTCPASDADCDYGKILQGTKNWPDPQTASTSDTVTTRIDDLWHAAVNGHGQYLSASNPDAVVSALSKTLAAISQINASAAAAATSSLEPVAGDNFAYVAQYTTGLWYGDLQARDIDLSTGALSATISWSAKNQLTSKVAAASDTRTIYTFSAAAGSKLKAFTSANLTTEKAAGYFKSSGSNPNGALSQYGSWNSTQQAAATDDAMINFLRGQSGNEDEVANANRLFRDRTFALGDIVDTSPVFVKKPPFQYTDTGYAAFATANASRTPMVYVGANDGMLHAFNAATGAEAWAYIPSILIPNLYKLADANYSTNHRFYVDGQVTVGDAYNGSAWKTILIGGLGGGGKGFYALDVTDPASPKALWEFSSADDGDMGYSYGNPMLTKRNSDGRWVVMFTSGYNNGGDSKGRLYVLDAFTGARLSEIITDNTVNDPNISGIGKANNFVVSTLIDNTTQYVYGGDLGGSLWRFDIDAQTSQRLGKTSATTGNQPITVRPELARVRDTSGTYYRVVYFGTGRYLGFSDISPSAPSSTVAQAIYAVKDTGSNLGVLTLSAANLVAQTLNSSGTPRTIPSPLPVDWQTKNGWYVALPVGERVNVDMRLQLGTLVALSNEPNDNYCSVGGRSWLYSFDYLSGTSVSSSNDAAVGQLAGNSIATGVTMIRLPNQKLVALVTLADTTVKPLNPGTKAGTGLGVHRVSWRELN